jgi:hypothetical protein
MSKLSNIIGNLKAILIIKKDIMYKKCTPQFKFCLWKYGPKFNSIILDISAAML